MPFVPDGRPLPPGAYYIPRLGRFGAPQRLPVPVIRFASRLRELFDEETYKPKYLDLTSFGDLADSIHILTFDQATDS
jgi:hypothetical protein